MKKIVIDPFDKKSIDAAIKEIEAYKTDFDKKYATFVSRLLEIGVSVAQQRFANAEYDGKNDVQVTSVQEDGRAVVVAHGETVGFIEFGTGVRYEEYDSSTTEYTPPPRGSYGKGKGSNPKGWFFTLDGVPSQHTYGNPPAEAMLSARDAMIESVVRIAREVWQ